MWHILMVEVSVSNISQLKFIINYSCNKDRRVIISYSCNRDRRDAPQNAIILDALSPQCGGEMKWRR
jgi:hypothetical protein